MINRIMKIILPTTLGIFTVIAILFVYNLFLFNGDAFCKIDANFFLIFVPIALIIAIIIQITLTIPFWKKFKQKRKIANLTLFQFLIIICVISGIIFGLIFWETKLGINELIQISIIGIIAFCIYWTINLSILRKLDKQN